MVNQICIAGLVQGLAEAINFGMRAGLDMPKVIEVISKGPPMLPTPLMSGRNAIHGIVLLGGLLVIGSAEGVLDELLLVIAIAFGTINVVGGFLGTDRMLGMFKGRRKPPDE